MEVNLKSLDISEIKKIALEALKELDLDQVAEVVREAINKHEREIFMVKLLEL